MIDVSNKKKMFICNTSWIVFERVIQMIIQLLVGIVSVRYLGPENYGTINYIGSYIALFSSICTLGLEGVVVKRIIEEPYNIGEIIGTSIVMRIFSSILSIVGILIMIFVIDDGNKTLLIIGLLQSVSLIFMSFEIIEFWFQSQLKSKYVTIAKTISTLIVSLWKIYLLMNLKNIYYFSVSATIQYIVTSIVLIYLYNKQDGQKLKISFSRAKDLLFESYHFILSGLMVIIYTQMDKIMIGKMINSEQVGIYTAATSIPGMYMFIFTALINSSRPIILEMKNINYSEYLKRLKQLYSLIIYIGLSIVIFMLFYGKLVMNLLYGSEYLDGLSVLNISIFSNIFSILGIARGIWVVSENKGKYVKKYLFWGAFINIIFNIILIPNIGIKGAAISTLLTEITTCIISPIFYKETRIHTKYIFEASILKWN